MVIMVMMTMINDDCSHHNDDNGRIQFHFGMKWVWMDLTSTTTISMILIIRPHWYLTSLKIQIIWVSKYHISHVEDVRIASQYIAIVKAKVYRLILRISERWNLNWEGWGAETWWHISCHHFIVIVIIGIVVIVVVDSDIGINNLNLLIWSINIITTTLQIFWSCCDIIIIILILNWWWGNIDEKWKWKILRSAARNSLLSWKCNDSIFESSKSQMKSTRWEESASLSISFSFGKLITLFPLGNITLNCWVYIVINRFDHIFYQITVVFWYFAIMRIDFFITFIISLYFDAFWAISYLCNFSTTYCNCHRLR